MRKNSSFHAVFLALAACGGADEAGFPDYRPQGEHRDVAVWIESDPLVPHDAVIAACDQWGALHVSCFETADRDAADIAVTVSGDDCASIIVNGQPATALMRAEGKRRMTMFSSCLSERRQRMTEADWSPYVQAKAAHEFGHLFGIRGHIAQRCDGTDDLPVLTHPSGAAICGPAFMNAAPSGTTGKPLYDIDFLMADMREPGFALGADPEPLFPDGTVPGCTITD